MIFLLFFNFVHAAINLSYRRGLGWILIYVIHATSFVMYRTTLDNPVGIWIVRQEKLDIEIFLCRLLYFFLSPSPSPALSFFFFYFILFIETQSIRLDQCPVPEGRELCGPRMNQGQPRVNLAYTYRVTQTDSSIQSWILKLRFFFSFLRWTK